MKALAGFIIAIGVMRVSFLTIATFMNIGTAAERIGDRFDAIVILTLGAILWQLSRE